MEKGLARTSSPPELLAKFSRGLDSLTDTTLAWPEQARHLTLRNVRPSARGVSDDVQFDVDVAASCL
jgi:hypothetical protein